MRVTSSSRRRSAGDARAHAPAVDLELRLAGAARADAAAQARQVLPLAREPRQQVLQLRQLHLQLAGQAVGALREDVEDELAAVDDLHLQRAFEVALLRRRQRVVEDDDVGAALLHQRAHLLNLARADEGCRVDAPDRLQRLGRRRCTPAVSARRSSSASDSSPRSIPPSPRVVAYQDGTLRLIAGTARDGTVLIRLLTPPLWLQGSVRRTSQE